MTNSYNDYTAYINASTNLTGTWIDQSGNTYYLNNTNENIWMLGLSADDGASWMSTFIGTVSDNKLIGVLTDIPNGIRTDVNNITLQISDDGRTLSTGSGFSPKSLLLTKV